MDALADAGGQQVLSPYHAMACNPALMVDPLGLQSGKSDPRPPGSLLTGGNVPGSSGWGAITGYYRSMLGPANQRPPELQGMLGAMAMMRILSGDAAGAASRMSPGGGSAMSSYEQMVQIDGWQRQWRRYANNRSENQKNILDAFAQFVYSIDNGYDIFDDQGNVIRTVLDEQVVQGGLQSNMGSNGSIGQPGFSFMNAGFTGKTESSGSFWYGGTLVIPSSRLQGGRSNITSIYNHR